MMKNTKIAASILLFLIIAAGVFLRTYHINQVPPGIYPDEAVNGEDAVRANQTGEYQWFYPANNGREGLFMNLVAVSFKFFGISPFSLKLPAIISGSLVILGTYLLTWELFHRRRISLISAYLVAFSFWAINFSRISFRANMLPLVLVFSFYFLFHGARTKKIADFIWAGILYGIGIHTYIAFRISPAILIALFLSFLLSRNGFLKEYWKHSLVFAVTVLIVFSPMFYTFYTHPEYLESRSASISILSPEVNQGNLPLTFLKSFGLSLIKYNFVGDMNWRHNYPPYPLLDNAAGTAFLFGLIYSSIKLLRLLWKRMIKKERDEKLNIHVLLVSWFFIMLAPEFMTYEGNPHALRAIGTLPAVFIFSAMTFEYLFRKAEHHGGLFKNFTAYLLVGFLVFIGLFNSLKYHYFWANKPEVAMAFEKNLDDISQYIRTLPPESEKFIVTGVMQRVPLKLFNEEMEKLELVYPGQARDISPQTKNFQIIFTEFDGELIHNLEKKFPNTKFEEKTDRFGISFYVLKNN